MIEALRAVEVSASLNYTSHIFGHSGGDSPFGKVPFTATVPPDAIRNQAAMVDVLHVPSAADEVPMEREVVVGVFDTAPVTESVFADLAADILASPGATGWYSGMPFTDSRDHGIFVSSLISTVAPSADVYLYKVLDDNGEGQTADIYLQVFKFLLDHPPSRNTLPVLNFSLGIWCDEPPPPDWTLEARPFAALDSLLDTAQKDGVVIVAAAGNDSNRYENYILGPAYPASAPFAISVGATNLAGGPTCYSHQAQVFAPGGDGVSSPPPAPNSAPIPSSAIVHCVPNHAACTDETCDYGMVGLSADSPSGYAFWPGTSFATPLVSGLAARLLAQGADPFTIQDRIHLCAPQNAAGDHILGDITGC